MKERVNNMLKKSRIYVDIHALQTVPPSCVNRDDTGSPKTAVYGGVTRARVSSQAWKRAMRLMFKDIFEKDQIALRTKRIVSLVADEIIAIDPSLDATKLAEEALKSAGLTIKDAQKGTDALFFMSYAQAKALAKLAADKCEDKKAYKEALMSAPSVDMILFGRMVASDPSLNYDAAAQVAHSISTHAVNNEYDYFTAVDDCAPEDNAGAGHLGTIEFNSATLYRYATVNVCELAEHLGEVTPEAVRGFVEAFVLAMPTGKQNTFANRTLPDAVYVTIRRDQPVNLSGAFERPVVSRNGYAEESKIRLAQYAKKMYESFVDQPVLALGVGVAMNGLAQVMPLSQLLDTMKNWVAEHLSDCEVS